MKGDYRSTYLRKICAQNRELFDSPHVWFFSEDDLPLDPRRRFSGLKHTYLEFGFGHGEVLEELAQRHNDTGFVGIERRSTRVKKALKRLHRIEAANVQLIRINLELIGEPLFVPGSFDQILINHPDPWPRRRHEHHRFFRPDALEWIADLLTPQGSVEVASDHADYFFTILRLFGEDPRFESLLPPPFYTAHAIPGRSVSLFEKRKRGAGQAVRILRYQRK